MKFKEWLVKNRRWFWVWQVVAIVVWVGILIYFQPWGDKMGVPQSPQRMTLWMVTMFWVVFLPTTLLAASAIAGNNRWLAPRGRYVEERDYPIFNVYTYTAIAFMAALFAVSGVVNFQLFDLPAAPATIAVTFFNPIIGFFTLWIGDTIRSLLFGGFASPLQWLAFIGLFDGATWIVLGLFYWWFREKTSWGKNPAALFIAWSIFYWVWRNFTNLVGLLIFVPANLYVVSFLSNQGTFMVPSYIASIGGLIVSEGLIRTLERREKAAVSEEEAGPATLRPK